MPSSRSVTHGCRSRDCQCYPAPAEAAIEVPSNFRIKSNKSSGRYGLGITGNGTPPFASKSAKSSVAPGHPVINKTLSPILSRNSMAGSSPRAPGIRISSRTKLGLMAETTRKASLRLVVCAAVNSPFE